MRLIDADAVLKKMQSTMDMQDLYPPILFKELVIDDMPTIEAEPVRHGRWIECESENGIHFHKCSECGKRDMYQGTFTDWNGRGFSFYFKRQYCPVCGVKMDLVEVNDMVKNSDLVEVVRCKDCKYFHDYGDGVKNCWGDGGGMKDDDYCSQAKRKDEWGE